MEGVEQDLSVQTVDHLSYKCFKDDKNDKLEALTLIPSWAFSIFSCLYN